jgi:predicted MFS family arabinose efflux permease
MARVGEGFGRGYRSWLLVLLLAINIFYFADRALLSTLAEPVKRDLAINDFQLGLLQGIGFALLYSILGLPIARAAERSSRGRIIAVAAMLWSLFAAACGLATNFAQFLLCRVGVGVGEAGFNPPVASLTADHWPASQRARIMALIGLGGAVGPLIASAGGGWIADHHGWRFTFAVIGAPGMLFGLLALLTIREPPRGLADRVEQAAAKPPSMMATARVLFAKPAFRHAIASTALGAMATNGIGQFLVVFFIRAFHLSLTKAGLLFGIISALAVTSGLLVGGYGADWLGRRDPRWTAWVSALGIGLCAPMFLAAFLQTNATAATIFAGLGSALLFVYYGPSLAILQNLAPPQMRASAAFLGAFASGIIGLGLGPALVGRLSDMFATMAYGSDGYAATCVGAAVSARCAAAASSGIRSALTLDTVIFVWAAFHYWLAARTLREDSYQPS